MPKNLTTILAKHSEQAKSEPLTFWHAGDPRTPALKSFLDDGIKAIGKGVGGQSSGFYVWNNKKGADSHFDYLFKRGVCDGIMLVGVNVNQEKLSYPTWQFDLEAANVLNPLFFKYKEHIQNMSLEYQDEAGRKTKNSISVAPEATPLQCFLEVEFGNFSSYMAIGHSGTGFVDFWQALVDKLCKNPEFKKDYNKLLQKSAKSSSQIALKYCGKKPLPVDELIYAQKNTKGSVKETKLYTSSRPKEKQVCPFVKKALADMKASRNS